MPLRDLASPGVPGPPAPRPRFTWLLALVLVFAGCVGPAPVATTVASEVLDGRAQIQQGPLAELALTRSKMGADWLVGISMDDGRFHYVYEPGTDSYADDEYNEVRHAGTTYALWQAQGRFRDDAIRTAAEKASEYIDRASLEDPGGRVFTYQGEMKLGGQALAIVALLERRRVTGDRRFDDLIGDLARVLLSMEVPAEPGRYYNRYKGGERSLEPPSDYYPGEALLALVRLAQQFPGQGYLERAVAAADYLVHVRDDDIPAAGTVPREDHWLTMALAELYRLRPDDGHLAVVRLQAASMIANQFPETDPFPVRIGASQASDPISYTSTATKGEALVAAWALALYRRDGEDTRRFSTAARRTAQFQMRVQNVEDQAGLFPVPEHVLGSWSQGPVTQRVRLDYVQHNISALLGVVALTKEEDLPLATPLP